MCYPNFTALIFVTISIFIKTNVGVWFKKSYQIRPTYRPTFDLPLCRYFIAEGIIPRVGQMGIPITLITWSAFLLLLLLLLFHCNAHILGWFYKTKKLCVTCPKWLIDTITFWKKPRALKFESSLCPRYKIQKLCIPKSFYHILTCPCLLEYFTELFDTIHWVSKIKFYFNTFTH